MREAIRPHHLDEVVGRIAIEQMSVNARQPVELALDETFHVFLQPLLPIAGEPFKKVVRQERAIGAGTLLVDDVHDMDFRAVNFR